MEDGKKSNSRSFALLRMTSNNKGKGNSRFPSGMTDRKAEAKAKAEAEAKAEATGWRGRGSGLGGEGALAEHGVDGGTDVGNGRASVIPLGVVGGWEDGHGGVCLKEEEVAVAVESEVDAAVVEGEFGLDGV